MSVKKYPVTYIRVYIQGEGWGYEAHENVKGSIAGNINVIPYLENAISLVIKELGLEKLEH